MFVQLVSGNFKSPHLIVLSKNCEFSTSMPKNDSGLLFMRSYFINTTIPTHFAFNCVDNEQQ